MNTHAWPWQALKETLTQLWDQHIWITFLVTSFFNVRSFYLTMKNATPITIIFTLFMADFFGKNKSSMILMPQKGHFFSVVSWKIFYLVLTSIKHNIKINKQGVFNKLSHSANNLWCHLPTHTKLTSRFYSNFTKVNNSNVVGAY